MRKWLVITMLLALLISPSIAGAQGETKLDAINIELWSEYDRPSMLVIYQFVVAQDTALPAELTLRFPKDSNLVAVAVEQNDKLFNKDFTTPVETGNWQTIKIKVESYDPHRIEYYESLTIEGNKRQFKYQWFGGYSVKTFNITTLVPADSTNLITSPVLQNTATSPDGTLITGTVTKNDVKMMDFFQFDLEYQRTSDALTKRDEGTAQVEPSNPVDENTPGRVSIANLPWIIGTFGVALIGIALFSYWRSTQSQSEESQPRRRRRQRATDVEDGQAYCHECGARAHAGDRFCRTCGSRLRLE
jgi:hypothetical protein